MEYSNLKISCKRMGCLAFRGIKIPDNMEIDTVTKQNNNGEPFAIEVMAHDNVPFPNQKALSIWLTKDSHIINGDEDTMTKRDFIMK